MKLNGIGGVGTGKLGSMVYSVRNGQQIVRQYNPIVANPSTEAQVAVRSKMKLMSQLAAIVAPAIAIPSEGLKSKRNLFISRNYELSSFDNQVAQIDMANVQLTKSNTAFPDFEVDRSGGQSIAIHLADDATNLFDRVIYCAVISQADGSLRLWDSVIATEAGQGGLFPATLPYTANAIAVYGYGIRSNSEDAKAAYANLKANDVGKLAEILTSRNATMEAITISETRGCVLEVGVTQATALASGQATITVTADGQGTVAGGGVKNIGETVTLTATPNQGYDFSRWEDENGNTLSEENPWAFTVTRNISVVGVFRVHLNPGD